jgi:3-oxoacyl-[acyl-carrier protein] reductase
MRRYLAGKGALVTGSSRGIGAAIAVRLASEGANVVISYNASREQAESLVAKLQGCGVTALAFRADQGRPSEVQQLVAFAHKALGRLDILVNSAGVFTSGKVDDPATDFSALDRQTKINLDGSVAAARAAAPLLPPGRQDHLNRHDGRHSHPLSRDGGLRGVQGCHCRVYPRPGGDLGTRGITVNVIQPGAIDTEMNPDDGPYADVLRGMAALGRYGRVEEVAGAVAFLAGPDASYITGATLNVDGGQLA